MENAVESGKIAFETEQEKKEREEREIELASKMYISEQEWYNTQMANN